MVGTRSGKIEPASSPPLPDRAKREQQESPRLEPGIPNPQLKTTVYSDSPFDGNINPADSSGLKLFLAATKGPDSKERITLGPETAILFLQLVCSLLSLYGWAILIGLIPDSNANKRNMLQQWNSLKVGDAFQHLWTSLISTQKTTKITRFDSTNAFVPRWSAKLSKLI